MSMRIAFLTTDDRENFREYDRPEPYFGTAPAALLQGMTELPELEVHVVCCVQRPIASPAKLAKNIWFHTLVVPKVGWLRTGYQGCIRAVRKKLRQIRPDIVHAQGTERNCGISGVFSGFPNVLTIHGNMRLISKVNGARPFSYQWLAARFESFTLPRAGGVICLSTYTQQAVSDLAKKTWVVPNAVDRMFFDVVRTDTSKPLILCVGKICLRKNQIQFIRALDPIGSSLNVLFLGAVVPQEGYDAEFLEMVRARPWCAYGGMADRQQLREHLSHATVLALPSLEDNCPMAVLEAMAAGVPVLAANVGGVPDLIQNERNGLLCDPTDQGSMRMSAERLMKDSDLRRSLSSRAKEMALKRYHPTMVARRHSEIYQEVLRTVS